MSGVYGSTSEADGIATIRRALDIGINLLDTADIYGIGQNETLVGRAIAGHREQAFVATKFGVVAVDGKPAGVSGKPEYIRDACEASLRRLNIETIDLYQQHRIDGETPIEETVGALAELVAEGKVRHIGLSEANPEDLRRAHAIHPITSLQSEYSLLERGVETEVLEVCAELGIGFLAFSPLMRGVLSGSLTPTTQLDDGDTRATDNLYPRVGPSHLEANAQLAQTVIEISSEHRASPAQVALAWLLSRRSFIVPIPGTKRATYVEDNSRAVDLELTQDDRDRLDLLGDKTSGDRYSQMLTPQVAVTPRA
jgi:aryl-alcohol dehydrogenase-like predicted oxidoreductase